MAGSLGDQWPRLPAAWRLRPGSSVPVDRRSRQRRRRAREKPRQSWRNAMPASGAMTVRTEAALWPDNAAIGSRTVRRARPSVPRLGSASRQRRAADAAARRGQPDTLLPIVYQGQRSGFRISRVCTKVISRQRYARPDRPGSASKPAKQASPWLADSNRPKVSTCSGVRWHHAATTCSCLRQHVHGHPGAGTGRANHQEHPRPTWPRPNIRVTRRKVAGRVAASQSDHSQFAPNGASTKSKSCGDRGRLSSIGTGDSAGPVPAMCLEACYPARSMS